MTQQSFLLSFGLDSRVVRRWMQFQAFRHGCRLNTGPYAWDLKKGSQVIRVGRRHFANISGLAADFHGIFDTLVAVRAGNQSILDFSHIQIHMHRASGLKFELAHWPETNSTIDAYFSRYQPTASDLVFDVGAGCGISTFALSNMARNVIALEPDAQLRVILERNITRLKLPNATVASESVVCFGALVQLYGKPLFCKVNLDRISHVFFETAAHLWTHLPIIFAANATSKGVRQRFSHLLETCGFQIDSDPALNMIWARKKRNAKT